MKTLSALRRKRIVLPLASVWLLAVALGVAVHRSDASWITVYNQTGTPLAALKVEACGQLHAFRKLGDEDSFRWKLRPAGVGGEIALETASEPVWRWRGAYIEPRGGYRLTLRLWPDGQVEAHTQISLWQRLLRGAPNINE